MRGKSTAAITVRGLDAEITAGLEQAASRHDRTKEGEARAAIRAWVQPELSAIEHSIREQGERLTFALRQVQQLSKGEGRHMTPSTVAERIGEARASHVVGGFLGEQELTFDQLERVSDLLGTSQDWLKHGVGTPYPCGFMDIHKASDLFSTSGENKVSKVNLVRTDDKTGNLYIIREFEDKPFFAEIFSTRYHISEEIGGGGEGDLCRLFPIFKELYKKHKLSVDSYLVNPVYVRPKDNGQELHPLQVAFHAKPSPWMDDIWDDESHSRTIEHWPGMIQLRKRILEAIDIKESRRGNQ